MIATRGLTPRVARIAKYWNAMMITYQVVSWSPWVPRFQDDPERQVSNCLQLVAELT
jgi:hypothetical protein